MVSRLPGDQMLSNKLTFNTLRMGQFNTGRGLTDFVCYIVCMPCNVKLLFQRCPRHFEIRIKEIFRGMDFDSHETYITCMHLTQTVYLTHCTIIRRSLICAWPRMTALSSSASWRKLTPRPQLDTSIDMTKLVYVWCTLRNVIH